MESSNTNPVVLGALILGISIVVAMVFYVSRTTDEQACIESLMNSSQYDVDRAQSTIFCRRSLGAAN